MGYRDLKKTFLSIGIIKVLNIFSNFLMTSMLIKILGDDSYGVYIAMFSLLAWVFLFDIGISTGMRNHLTQALIEKNALRAKQLISTAAFTVLGIAFIFMLTANIVIGQMDLSSFFNISIYTKIEILFLFSVFLFTMFISLIFSSMNQVLYAIHKSSAIALVLLIINLFFISFLACSWFFGNPGIFLISIFYAVSVTLSYLGFAIYFFSKNPQLTPSIFHYSKPLIKVIMADGMKIFVIQIMFFTFLGFDRFILLKFTAADSVTNYDIMYKVMSLLLFPWSIIAQPLWSSYAEAYKRKETAWIKKIYLRLIAFFIATAIGAVFLSYQFEFITRIWLGKALDVQFGTLLLTGLLILVIMWFTMHSDILFGLNKFKIPLIAAAVGLFIKILILYWSVETGFTVTKILCSSIFAYGIFCVWAPFNVFKLLGEKP